MTPHANNGIIPENNPGPIASYLFTVHGTDKRVSTINYSQAFETSSK